MAEEQKPGRGPLFSVLAALPVIALALLAFEGFYYLSSRRADQSQFSPWVGVRAPDFTVTNLDGKAIHLADFKGKRVILNFWATWCPPCREELPGFIKLRSETPSTKVVILGLSTDAAAAQRAFARSHQINYPLAVMGILPSPYGEVALIPTTMVIDRHGVIEQVAVGIQGLSTLEQFASEPDFSGSVKPAPAGR
ncbi:MAG: TlpA family protein disulfide reductase [Verrucomicrobia bacterium]|nr:TlpA family protein disulfide reductase [Verrucomicrobiota bacterium]MDE3099294.1 redoxin domain-containing protein [Verrucomicrobiota bacterium]